MLALTFENIHQHIGQQLGQSDWLPIDQGRINAFADCTGDHQWIHVDVERAQHESPFGTTIAHGYLTLSLLPYFQNEMGLMVEGCRYRLNYGLNKLRFMTAVKAGDHIRDTMTLTEVADRAEGQRLITVMHTVEIQGETKPAMVAETLALLVKE
jgi:acyl dehydratase